MTPFKSILTDPSSQIWIFEIDDNICDEKEQKHDKFKIRHRLHKFLLIVEVFRNVVCSKQFIQHKQWSSHKKQKSNLMVRF